MKKEDLHTTIENTVREKGVQEFPIYECFKGKQMNGSKTWQAVITLDDLFEKV